MIDRKKGDVSYGISLGYLRKSHAERVHLEAAKKGGFDFLEISVDESNARLSRLEWSDGEIRELYDLSRSVGLPIETMCLSGHRKYPMGSGVPKIRARSMDIMKKAIRLADGLGVRIIQLAGYDVYYHESSTAETRERFIEGLRISRLRDHAGAGDHGE